MDRLSELAHQLRTFANECPLPKLLPDKEVIDLVILHHPKKPKSATNHAYPPDWLLIERNRSLLRKDIKEFWRLFNKAELTEAEERIKERKKPELDSPQVTSPSKKPVRVGKRKIKIFNMADRYPTTPSEASDTETKPAADEGQAPEAPQEKDTKEAAELEKEEPSGRCLVCLMALFIYFRGGGAPFVIPSSILSLTRISSLIRHRLQCP